MKKIFVLLALLLPFLTYSQVGTEWEEEEAAEEEELLLERALIRKDIEEAPMLDEPVEDVEEFDVEYVDDDVMQDVETHEFPEALMNHPFIRYQHKVNSPNEAEAYPWISANGLTLYFIKGHSIFFSERKSRYEDFNKPKELDISEGSVTSCWLTNDELNLYTTSYSSSDPVVKKYSRTTLNDRFQYQDQLVFADDEVEGFTSAISFTPDMKTALMYNNPNDDDRSLVIFDVLIDGRLQFRDRFRLPSGSTGVGQLSKDGGTVYFTDEHSAYHKVIYKIPLVDIGKSEQRIEKVLELKGVRIGKPCLTYDETYMVFNASANDVWQDNEIMVVDLNNLEFIEQDSTLFDLGLEEEIAEEGWTVYPPLSAILEAEAAVEQINPIDAVSQETEKEKQREAMANVDASSFMLNVNKIYPNPTKGKVTVEYHVPVNAAYAELIINDMSGREIYRKNVGKWSSTYEVNLKELGILEGYYVFFVKTELGASDTKKIYFQSEQ